MLIKNLGKTDRLFRAMAGIVMIALGFYFYSWLIIVGGLILLTSALSFCPIYAPFGWSTRKSIKDSGTVVH